MAREGPPAPVIRPKKLAEALSAIALAHGPDCSGQEARKAVLQCLREANEKGRDRAEAMLAEDGGGIACAFRISGLNDTLLVALHRFVVKHVYPVTNPTSSEHLAIVAVGGYGRGTLAPGSDIDLLFLLPYKQTPWGEQVVEYILYMLWDLGLKVGHSTRSIPECIRQAKADMTVRTALLEARYICGRRPLFNSLTKTFDKEIVAGTGEEFVAHKLAERDERHRKAGKVRYLVEPDVKESKGGLRDLHTLFWIARYFYRVERRDDLVDRGVLSRRELRLFRKAEDFLWAVRCHLHFLTGKAEERLSFELQSEIAVRLGYTAHPGMRDVERFMKHYFLIAKTVGDLTRILCAAVEAEQARQTTPLEKLFRTFSPKARKAIPGTLDFVTETGRIQIADDNVFERDPVNIVRIFHLADRNRLDFHPDALKRLTRSLKLVDDTLRQSPEANGLFIGILTSPRNPELVLRRMNEAGVLGRFVPDFGRIVAMMQFNMYHHYTVDEHLLQSIGVLAKIEKGTEDDQHPLAQKLIGQIENRTVLYVALLLHDIAKGRPEDHSVAGAEVARNLCPRLGLSPAETETVAWLIEEHLTMSMVAQTRDLTDRKTIQDLADRVQTLERLKLLLILTVCDIRAVGPGVWNGWKGQLLRTLFYETELEITGGFSEVSRDQRVVEAQSALSASLEEWTDKERQAYLDLHYPNYLLSVALDDQVYHAEFVRRSDAGKKRFSSLPRTDAFKAMTEIVILTVDHPRLLSIIAGACAAAGANIADAQIFTTRDGRALDVVVIGRAFDSDEDELRRAGRIGQMIEGSLSGKAVVGDAIAKRTKLRRARAFAVKPAIRINNRLSNRFTVIEVEGLDRPGLLAELTAALADLSLDIASAHISTFGEKIVDSFYVNDLTGAKITSANRQANIRTRLEAILADRDPASGDRFAGGILASAAE